MSHVPSRHPPPPLPTLHDIRAAHDRIRPHIHRTPVLTCAALDGLSGARLLFKAEPLQKGGAFKARGACNAVFSLDDVTAAGGVATQSSGNHGQALCYAAARRGIPATVVMPRTAPRSKRDAVLGYGGRVIACEPSNAARDATLTRVAAETGVAVVHPYNDVRVIAGQGTCAVELLQEAGSLDALVAPIGGGGLVSGCALALAALSPATAVYAAEPANADDAHRSLKAGRLISMDAPDTLADGLRASMRDLTWAVVSRHVRDILLVTEDAIVAAMALLWQRLKIVVEPSAAVPLAAILARPDLFAGRRVGVILTGGNVDLDALPWTRAAPEEVAS
ncbi:pyridoxal-phosphate dependent enzyme [Roseospira visakhapatnamensis]|uniref:Threonine dehydratase n=1 Tax=Roseospira visakhapatnamensis TaxID=390880 RepID=A0A7W6WAM9_9PROT|nr:pyridoxal-phosphate dependent enzyme [Roseospira visakhapatnamensis]MBB4267350.1 threonine dehydratase [Roseospira visakhapatnamensis]